MIWSIAWRNIWRNKVRSGIIMTAIAIGIFAGVYSIAFMIGMVDQRINSAINTEISNIQLHHPDFRKTKEKKDFIRNANTISHSITNIEEVSGVSRRIIFNGMASSAESGSGIQLFGIIPGKEKMVTNIHSKMDTGSYFGKNTRNPAVIGTKLMEKLDLNIGSKLVVTLQDMEGTITSASLRIVGAYNIANTALEKRLIFVKLQDLARITGFDTSNAHEIAVRLKENELTTSITKRFKSEYSQLDVNSWMELSPELSLLKESSGASMYAFVIIILLALGFAIVNTMLMVILERAKELGMLMAIGMSKRRVFLMILLETTLLSLVGGVTGIIIAVGITLYTGYTGIDLSVWSEGIEKFGYDTMLYPTIGVEQVVIVTILVILTGILASIYPARKAVKMNPAEAIKTK